MPLIVRHLTRYRYTPGTLRAVIALKLWPESTAGQRVLDWRVTAADEELFPTPDRRGLLALNPVPEVLEFVAEGIVETTDTAGVLPLRVGDPHPYAFLKETPLTAPDPAIRALADDAAGEGETTLARLHAIARAVHGAVAYRSGATGPRTSAAEALAQGSGVCQDHAHLFISAARSLGLPARYVVGYLHAGVDELALHETHAWAEAYVDDLGWVGFDASNAICPTERYIRLTTGLDARDAAPIRGHIVGGRDLAIEVDVRITDATDADAGEVVQRQQQEQTLGSMRQSQSQSQARPRPRERAAPDMPPAMPPAEAADAQGVDQQSQ